MTYPSVTEVIGLLSDFSRVPPDVLQEASERGTHIHQICAAIAKGLWVPDYPENLQGYIKSFNHWILIVKKVIAVEPELTCPTYHFKGHPDLIVWINGDVGLTLLDIKSPVQKQKTWRLQISSYYHLAKKKWPDINRVGSLRLSPDGAPAKLDEYSGSLAADFNIFVSQLNVFNFMRRE